MIPTSLVIDTIIALKKNDNQLIDENIKKIIWIVEKKWQVKLLDKLKKVYSNYNVDKPNNNTFTMQNFSVKNNNLFQRRVSTVNLSNIILSDINKNIVDEFITSYTKRAIFREHWIASENKILLYWPPGTWKTLFAYTLAGELNLPILHVNLANLISSYLWETWKNIRSIFEEALKENCILFIDEFDAIAKKRDDNQELWELKRVVTVLLQNIDSFTNDNILIAATNHEQLLDEAIWRRFDYQLNIDTLDNKSIEKLLKMYLNWMKEKIDFDILVILSNWLSWSLIKQVINKWLRNYILDNKKLNINLYLIESFIFWNNFFKNLDFKKDDDKKKYKEIILKLREYNLKFYTYKKLEELTNIPDSTLNHYFNS